LRLYSVACVSTAVGGVIILAQERGNINEEFVARLQYQRGDDLANAEHCEDQ